MDPRKRAWIYAGLGLAAGVGLVMAAAPPKTVPSLPPAPGKRILLIGDSLAQALAAPLKQLIQVPFLADGRQSTRIDQWANEPWLASVVKSFQPTVILVSLGTNDMRLADPGSEKIALELLVATLRATGAEITWIGPPTMPFPDRGVRFMIDRTGLSVFRSDALVIPRGPDGIHPTASGAAGWAGAIWGWLNSQVPALGSYRMARRPKRMVG